MGCRLLVFDFDLPKKKNTFWAIRDPRGETLKPEFRGRLWLDSHTGQVLRRSSAGGRRGNHVDRFLHLSADYAMTKVSDVGTYLLPVKSESKFCLGGPMSNLGCTTNTVIFHDYQKFTATARILPSNSGP